MHRLKVSWLDAMSFKGSASKHNITSDFAPQVFYTHVYHVCVCVSVSVYFFYNMKKLKTITILHKNSKGKLIIPCL